MGGAKFDLEARVELTLEEAELVRKYKAEKEVLLKKEVKKPDFKDVKAFVSETNEDYKICDITILRSWISEKYKL